MAVEASQILFRTRHCRTVKEIGPRTFLGVFEGVPQFIISPAELQEGIKVVDLLAEKAMVFPSKGELRRTVQGNGLSINKEKVSDPESVVTTEFLIGSKYILIQKGKKNYFLLVVEYERLQ